MFEFKPDFEESMQRMEAFWKKSVLDRPVIQYHLEKPFEKQIALPTTKQQTSAKESWMDVEYQAQLTFAQLSNQVFMGDSLPVAFPNLGPEVLASFYGCPLQFGEYGTSWTEPILKDWSEAEPLKLNLNSPYFYKLVELTDAMLEIGRGKFIVGMPDFHPGGDLVAALRNPQDLAIDLIEHAEQVKTLLKRLQPDYFSVYDFWYEKLQANHQPITSWLELASYSKYYIPSNDFSAMISTKMYKEFFLQGIIDECKFLDRSIYHLDGSAALRHLDCILDISELDAVQWVPGAGREGFSKWINVYQKIQAARKSLIVYCTIGEIELVKQTLKPNGLAISISGVNSPEIGESILLDFKNWTKTYK